jgi:ElaB/YqjD/DUF883 family membrane-anchored ribosome-binding protein
MSALPNDPRTLLLLAQQALTFYTLSVQAAVDRADFMQGEADRAAEEARRSLGELEVARAAVEDARAAVEAAEDYIMGIETAESERDSEAADAETEAEQEA